MIINMATKDSTVTVYEAAFDLENGVTTLPLEVIDGYDVEDVAIPYSLTGKTITAVFSETGYQSEPLEVIDGIVQLPIAYGQVTDATNYIQLFFRWGTDTVDIGPKMRWEVLGALDGTAPTPAQVDIITWTLAQIAALDGIATDAASDASGSAAAALASGQAAALSEQHAGTSETNASQSAQDAALYAGQAGGYAGAAGDSAVLAADHMNDALDYALAALQSASDASGYAAAMPDMQVMTLAAYTALASPVAGRFYWVGGV